MNENTEITPAARTLVTALPDAIREKIDNLTGTRKLNHITPTRLFKIRELLEKGEDPFIIATYFHVPFAGVAEIANNVLQCRGVEGRIPTTAAAYLELAERVALARDLEVAQSQSEVETEVDTTVKPVENGGANALDALAGPVVAQNEAALDAGQFPGRENTIPTTPDQLPDFVDSAEGTIGHAEG